MSKVSSSRQLVNITRDSLGSILKPIAYRKRADGTGQMRGNDAYRVFQTLELGRVLDHSLGAGVEISFRLLDDEDRQKTRIHLFRKGMWISSNVPGLAANDLSGFNPCDAVLALQDGEFEQLVRSAEGPEHRGLQTKRLTKVEKKRLKEITKEVAELLKEAAGKRQNTEETIIPGFASIAGDVTRKVETRSNVSGGGGGKKKANVRSGKKRLGGKGKGPRKHGSPRSGSHPAYAYSVIAEEAATTVVVDLDLREHLPEGTELGIRLTANSGSDASCDQPFKAQFLGVQGIKNEEGALIGSLSDPDEWLIPAVEGRQQLTIETVEPVTRPSLLELNVVKRRRTATNEEGEAA